MDLSYAQSLIVFPKYESLKHSLLRTTRYLLPQSITWPPRIGGRLQYKYVLIPLFAHFPAEITPPSRDLYKVYRPRTDGA